MAKNDKEEMDVQRWTAKRKAAVVLDIIKGKTTLADAARAGALTVAEVEAWVEQFVKGGEEHLRSHPRDLAEQFEAEKKQLYAKIGQLSLENDILKKADAIAARLEQEGKL